MATDAGNEHDISYRETKFSKSVVQDVWPPTQPPHINDRSIPSEHTPNA